MGLFCDVDFPGLTTGGSLPRRVLAAGIAGTRATHTGNGLEFSTRTAWMGCPPFSHALVSWWGHGFACCDLVWICPVELQSGIPYICQLDRVSDLPNFLRGVLTSGY